MQDDSAGSDPGLYYLEKILQYLHNWVNLSIPQFSANLNHSIIIQRFGTWPSSGNNNEYRGSHTRAVYIRRV